MHIVPGRCSMSAFRLTGLLGDIQARVPNVKALHQRDVFLVDLAEPLSQDAFERLEGLLDYGDGERGQVEPSMVIIPRPGTISPWSSKATDILHHAGLSQVRRVERVSVFHVEGMQSSNFDEIASVLHDRMTQAVVQALNEGAVLFRSAEPAKLTRVPVVRDGARALREANERLGLALANDEIAYLVQSFRRLSRDPTDVELMMFAQANSEHCRHKIFNASWNVDGQALDRSLFQMIKNTFKQSPEGVLSAYSDNSAVVEGVSGGRFFPEPMGGAYRANAEPVHMLMKVETHNHPTGISPHPGAGTGNGGEIRDEGATGRGSKPKAGLSGFCVSHLHLPDMPGAWEVDPGKPDRIASAQQIMLEGPIGGAAYNNEFGRPNLCGFFRSFCMEVPGHAGPEWRGYHKPIMIAGGYGNIRAEHVEKKGFPAGAKVVVLGGPAMLIGLGGGAASSVATGSQSEDLDFASVQRANPEMERRCQEVIDACWALGDGNPILSVHDVGAGGLSNALPELVHDAGRGARFQLREIPNAEPGMSPLELWCNESQERYVLAIDADRLSRFEEICKRERAIYAVIGESTEALDLVVEDSIHGERPIDVPLSVILGKPPKMHRSAQTLPVTFEPIDADAIDLAEAAERVLRLPTVASKSFLITIGDRSITGYVARDQMVGPWQVPVADVATTTATHDTLAGEAMAMGERTPVSLLDAGAAARLAVGEALTNLAAAPVQALDRVVLSANWMVSAGDPGEDVKLVEAVRAVGMELCPALGIAIPVGKDSMSMRSVWEEEGVKKRVTAPLSLIISAFAPSPNAGGAWTPQLKRAGHRLILVDLGGGKSRLGGSALGQVFGLLGAEPPDLEEAAVLKHFFEATQALHRRDIVQAYHDRSDGGLFVTLCEMAFAGHLGVSVQLDEISDSDVRALFSEELGAVFSVAPEDVEAVLDAFGGLARDIGQVTTARKIVFKRGKKAVLKGDAVQWHQAWAEVSYRMQSQRDNPRTARQEYEALADKKDPGISPLLTFEPGDDVAAPMVSSGVRPKVAILREQGVNGQIEMAAAFDRAGFEVFDVHMSDLISGRHDLADFHGLAACGGFSYGDVLGAGGGWAKTILYRSQLRDAFEAFFNRDDTFSLGICNGCQMMSHLAPLIPGAAHWPRFLRNESEQFEARVSTLLVEDSPSVLLAGMAGSRIPVAVAHGEGRVVYTGDAEPSGVAVRYVDNHGKPTTQYPLNPNGSPGGMAGFTSDDGRATIMMPHPERVFRTVANSYAPEDWGPEGPWLRLFRNARVWVG